MPEQVQAPFLATTAAGTTVTVRFGTDGDSSLPRFAVAYWSIRGLGAPLRMMLCAAKRDFTVFLYDLVEEDPEKTGRTWSSPYFDEKPQLVEKHNVPLLNLPYVVDRDQKRIVCQTNACLAYLAREVGMWGQNEEEASLCEQLLCELYDLRNHMVKFAYGGDASPKAAEKALDSAVKHFKKLDSVLELKKADEKVPHLVGDGFTAPDFHLFELLDQYDALCKFYGFPDCLKDFSRLRAFKTGFEKLSDNKFYLESMLYSGLPLNNKTAIFGSAPGGVVYKRGETVASWDGKGEITLSSTTERKAEIQRLE